MSDREDDLTLLKFLRQHQGVSPPSAPDLEARIMQAVATCPRLSRSRRYLWIVPSAIAVGSVLTWVGTQFFIPLTAPVETAEVEEFWTENWEAVSQEPTIQDTSSTSTTVLADELLDSHPTTDYDVSSTQLTTYKR
ncbi:hypothetical protein [Merismopedia glauca]|uniref:Uncharacterized protein n=1 Tax=Merismopedia glauca CCAP 1448/3 TaxID=1296344 RepID=A0A2T1C4B2_9CYAN|nr:hypothetical protein [Merismopedia glauca]PSB03096.1 hypothetical protein C7B64_10185 [Merismopedia glauca CCAP 1448/3]